LCKKPPTSPIAQGLNNSTEKKKKNLIPPPSCWGLHNPNKNIEKKLM
jgi:hypothetical protein